MPAAKVAFISFGFFAYPQQFTAGESRRVFDGLVQRGANADYFGPAIEAEDSGHVLEQLKRGGYSCVIAHITTWTTSPVVIRVLRECQGLPILVWGMGGRTVDGTLVSPAGAAGASGLLHPLRQMGIRYKYIYDYPDCEPKYGEALSFIAVANAIQALNGAQVGAMGYCDMGLYSLMLDGVALKRQLGMDVEDIFSAEMGRLAGDAPEDAVQEVIAEMRECLAFDEEPDDERLEKTARLTWALRKTVRERNYAGVTMKCVHGVSRYMGFTPCLTQALLAREIPSICESDVPGLITEVILQKLTGEPSTFLENYEYYPDAVLAGVCGFVPFAMAQGGKVRCMCAGWGGFTGIYETPEMREGRITIARLYSEGGALKMLLMGAEGTLPGKWAELGWQEPAPRFPSLLVKPDCTVDQYAQGMVSQHINIVYGDHMAQIRDFCHFTGIEVVELN